MSDDDQAPSGPTSDPAGPSSEGGTEVYRPSARPFDAIFAPRGVAVLGDSVEPGSPGRMVLANLEANPGGAEIFAIVPDGPSLASRAGVACFRSLGEVAGAVDLAVLVGPAATIPDRIAECAAAGVGVAIVVESGCGGDPVARADWRSRVLDAARRGRVRLLGPGSAGVMRPAIGLDATVIGGMIGPGGVAFFARDGAIAAEVGDWGRRAGVGFSALGALGSGLDLGWGELIDALGDDPATRAIVLAPGAEADVRDLLAAAREVAARKPIIVVAPERTDPTTLLAADPTAADARDALIGVALRRCAISRAAHLADVFHLADALTRSIRPTGSRLAIVAEAPEAAAALAAAALVEAGGTPVRHEVEAPGLVERAAAVLSDPATDGVLVILQAGGTTDLADAARSLVALVRSTPRPVMVSVLGGPEVAAAAAVLRAGGVDPFPAPDTAARVFMALGRHGDDLCALAETPDPPTGAVADLIPLAEADALIARAMGEGRATLDEVESKAVLRGHGLPVIATRVAATEAAAVAAAGAIGYPVALKLYSRTVPARAEMGGVHLDLRTAAAVRAAFWGIEATVGVIEGPGHMLGVVVEPSLPAGGVDLVLGCRVDPGLGPVIEFGAGGSRPGIAPDRAVELPPLTPTLARRLVERTRVGVSLRGGGGRPPVDPAALERCLVAFGRLVLDRPRIAAIEVDLVASAAGVTALDARITLHPASVAAADLPRPVFRPYPSGLVAPFTATNGGTVVVRPVRVEDEPLLIEMHRSLVERPDHAPEGDPVAPPPLSRAARDRIARVCRPDYDRTMTLVVDHREPWTDRHEVLGVGRLRAVPATGDAEVALVVALAHRCRGFATELLRRLLLRAKAEGFARVVAAVAPDDHAGHRVAAKFGFRAEGTGPLVLELATYSEPVTYPPAPGDDAEPQAGPLAQPTPKTI